MTSAPFSPHASPPFSRRFRWLRPLAMALGVAALTDCGKLDVPEFTQCAVSPTTVDFGAVAVGGSAERTFTVTNRGRGVLRGAVSEPCTDFALVDSLSYTLDPGASRTFTLRFAPSQGGSRSCTVSIGDCSAVTATGQGLAASSGCELSTTTLGFGTVAVGASADASFTITNTGATNLSGTVQESCPEFSLVGGGGYDLAPAEQATFTVRFAPTSGGLKSCTLDTGGLCADVSASGTGQAPAPEPQCQISTATLSFGTVALGDSTTRTFTIQNVGGGTLTGNVTESCLDFAIAGSSSYALDGGESATITVRFTPLTGGDKSCVLDPGAGCSGVTASGTGQILAGSCQLSATTIDFQDVSLGQVADRSLVITNNGLGTLSGTLSESCPTFSIVGTASYSLAPLQSATFTLRFAPEALGDATCALDAGSSCGTVNLKGKGVPVPACELSAVSYDFGSVEVGKHKDHTIDVRNVGGGQLCGTATESCELFSIASEPIYCAIPGTPYHLKVRFTPTRAGSFECTVDPGSGCPAITVRGVGVATQ